MNATPRMLCLLAVLGTFAALAPAAEADVTVCRYNWVSGCAWERTVETDLVECDLYVYVPIVDCTRCPVNRCGDLG